MIVYLAFEFEDVAPNTQQAEAVLRDICEACETMRVGLDATSSWVETTMAPENA